MKLIESGRQRNDPRALGIGLGVLVWVDVAAERLAEAKANAEECMRIAVTPFDRNFVAGVPGLWMIANGELEEGIKTIQRSRDTALSSGWTYYVVGMDAPVGIWMVLRGDIAAGVRHLKKTIRKRDAEGYAVVGAWNRYFLADVYLEILTSNKRPKISVLIKNFPFILLIKLTGKRKIRELLSQAEKCRNHRRGGPMSCLFNLACGRLLNYTKKSQEARSLLLRARAVAVTLDSPAIISRTDAVLADLPP